MAKLKVGGVGYPPYGEFFPPIVKRNYGKWVAHRYLRTGVIERVSSTGERCIVVRVLGPPNGMYSTDTIRWFVDVVEEYAEGLRVTARNSLELVGVKPEKLDELLNLLRKEGWPVGGTGNTLHQIVCCSSFLYCQQAVIDGPSIMKAIADALYQDFMEEGYPAKLKISISGCPNNCGEGITADIGIVGQFTDIPRVGSPEDMKKCEIPLIVATCPGNAIRAKQQSVEVLPERCVHCGSCAIQCAYIDFGTPETATANIYVGGKSSNTGSGPALGKLAVLGLKPKPPKYEEIVECVKRIIDEWKSDAREGERIADWIDRIGWERFYKKTGFKVNLNVIDDLYQNIVALRTDVRFRW